MTFKKPKTERQFWLIIAAAWREATKHGRDYAFFDFDGYNSRLAHGVCACIDHCSWHGGVSYRIVSAAIRRMRQYQAEHHLLGYWWPAGDTKSRMNFCKKMARQCPVAKKRVK